MTQSASRSDPLQRLEALVPLCDSIRKGTEYAAALAQARGEVLKAAAVPDRLESIEPVLRLLKGTQHIRAGDLLADIEKLEHAGYTLEQSASAEALKDARFSVREIQEALLRIEALIRRAWGAEVQSEFGPLQRLATVLAGIPDTRMVGIELQDWAQDAQRVSEHETPTAESVNQFKRAQAELTDRIKVLGTLGIDTAVRAFLLEVASEKATLAGLTPEVLEWLRAKNAHARFRIQLT